MNDTMLQGEEKVYCYVRRSAGYARQSIWHENRETEGIRMDRSNDLKYGPQNFDFLMKECRTVFWENSLNRLNSSRS